MEGSEDRLRAFCSITFDHSFVVRDLKVIEGASGPFVAMPSRKLSAHCARCHYKNHLRAAFCNQCGAKLRVAGAADSPQKLYADVAHPVNSECRELIASAVLAEFESELSRASEPGYRSRYDDDFESISESSDDFPSIETPQSQRPKPAESTQPVRPPSDGELRRVDQRPDGGGSPPPPHLDPRQSVESASPSSPPSTRSGTTPPQKPPRDAAADEGFGAGIFD